MGAAVGEKGGEVRVGSLVWACIGNGVWWPGRVLGPGDMTSFPDHRFQIQLLGQDTVTMDCYNLESSRRVKAFRCGEFDDCIRKAKLSEEFASTESLKYVHRKNAILLALDLERQLVQNKQLKRPGSEMQVETCSREKIRKHGYFTVESADCLNNSVESRSLRESPKRLQDTTANTSEPMESDLSESVNDVKMGKPSGTLVSRHENNNETSEGVTSYSSESSTVQKTAAPAIPQKPKHQRKRSVQELCQGVAGLYDDANCVFDYKGVKAMSVCASVFPSNDMETLFDAQIKFLPSCRGVDVPLVCMMSRLNEKAIIGHPVNIEVLKGTRATTGKKSYHLVWKTCKRTPVMYSPPLPSTREIRKMTQACDSSFGGMTCSAPNGDFSGTEGVPLNSGIKQPRSRKVYHGIIYNPHTTIQKALKDGTSKGVACVPVRHVMRTLLAALCKELQNY
ncbi:unnamed protein product [Cuscuta campestris]|uniref:PWWP domain-containing protein n=2 Tax=Cuscuta sect. Cleistogrammica TaxID=1824901 RepID=A0A484L3G9_9ASTE|nr:hypothetical protein DM860_013115 [Cuscuta australis]VFQ70863.1 unnamed protein product [Cuscuta campestris]